KPHTSSLSNIFRLTLHVVNKKFSFFTKLLAGSIFNSYHVASVFNDSKLHPKTNTKEWLLVCSCIFNSRNYSFSSTGTNDSRNKNPIYFLWKISLGSLL